jgi:hypothetical protein
VRAHDWLAELMPMALVGLLLVWGVFGFLAS